MAIINPFNFAENGKNLILKNISYYLGYVAGKTKSKLDDQMFLNLYTMAQSGTLPPDAIQQAMDSIKGDNPLLAGQLMLLLQFAGATFSGPQVVNLGAIDPASWDAIKAGFLLGQSIGVNSQS